MSPSKDESAHATDKPAQKIALKGFSLGTKPGAKPINFATKNKPLTTTLGKRPRTALHHGYDDEDEEVSVRHEAVTGFDFQAGGAQKEFQEVKGLLVIPVNKSRDWREEIKRATAARKGKNLLPPEVQAQRAGKGRMENTVDVVNGESSEPQWGLTITKKTLTERDNTSPESLVANGTEADQMESVVTEIIETSREKTDDELALEALIGAQTRKKGPTLVIPAVGQGPVDAYIPPPQLSEGDAYRRAVDSAPDVSTLEDYDRVPVEEFGAALLRGMGWIEGDAKKGRVARPKDAKRRQNLLGLGATELKGAEELGAWVQKSDPKRLGTGSGRGGERRPKANEYKAQKEKKRENRDERYGGNHRSARNEERGHHRDRDWDSRH